MIRLITERTRELNALCRAHSVLRLEVFGSASTGKYRPGQSDLDFLVEFRELSEGRYADAYFGLQEALEDLFDRPVDLIVESAIRNPYFRESVNQTRQTLYAD